MSSRNLNGMYQPKDLTPILTIFHIMVIKIFTFVWPKSLGNQQQRWFLEEKEIMSKKPKTQQCIYYSAGWRVEAGSVKILCFKKSRSQLCLLCPSTLWFNRRVKTLQPDTCLLNGNTRQHKTTQTSLTHLLNGLFLSVYGLNHLAKKSKWIDWFTTPITRLQPVRTEYISMKGLQINYNPFNIFKMGHIFKTCS